MRAFALVAAATLAGCATVPPDSGGAAVGQLYKAVGTEPFWALELTGREMIFSEANTGTPVVQPQPDPIHGFAGDVYQGARINLNIVRGVGCSDGMSDRTYPDKVQVDVDGRRFEGCGGEPRMPASLANSSWTVESINGRPTGGGAGFQIQFTGDRLSGRFGCNRAGGSYRLAGAVLNVGPLAMTRMACPDMSFEEQAAQILSYTLTTDWRDGERLHLRNDAGEIVLKRNI